MEFKDVLSARHSVRYFENKPVEVEVLREIVARAQLAPSWVNAQDWRVRIATGEALEKIRAEFARRVHEKIAPNSDIPMATRTQWSPMAQENSGQFAQARADAGLAQAKMDAQAYLFHAPAVAFLTLGKDYGPWAIFDLGGFSQTLMLAAADLGVGSVVAYNLATYPDVIREVMDIGEEETIVIGIALGYEADHPLNTFRSQRRALDDVLKIK